MNVAQREDEVLVQLLWGVLPSQSQTLSTILRSFRPISSIRKEMPPTKTLKADSAPRPEPLSPSAIVFVVSIQ